MSDFDGKELLMRFRWKEIKRHLTEKKWENGKGQNYRELRLPYISLTEDEFENHALKAEYGIILEYDRRGLFAVEYLLDQMKKQGV